MFHYFRRRRSSRNCGSLISNTALGGNTPSKQLELEKCVLLWECLQPEVEVEIVKFPELGNRIISYDVVLKLRTFEYTSSCEPERGKVDLGETGEEKRESN
ncbi:hypothetical protein Tco_0766331 [Tanacetum coccineum]